MKNLSIIFMTICLVFASLHSFAVGQDEQEFKDNHQINNLSDYIYSSEVESLFPAYNCQVKNIREVNDNLIKELFENYIAHCQPNSDINFNKTEIDNTNVDSESVNTNKVAIILIGLNNLIKIHTKDPSILNYEMFTVVLRTIFNLFSGNKIYFAVFGEDVEDILRNASNEKLITYLNIDTHGYPNKLECLMDDEKIDEFELSGPTPGFSKEDEEQWFEPFTISGNSSEYMASGATIDVTGCNFGHSREIYRKKLANLLLRKRGGRMISYNGYVSCLTGMVSKTEPYNLYVELKKPELGFLLQNIYHFPFIIIYTRKYKTIYKPRIGRFHKPNSQVEVIDTVNPQEESYGNPEHNNIFMKGK